MTLPKILVVSLGGTITMTSGAMGVSPSLGADDLVEAVPQLREIALIEASSFAKIPGAHISFSLLSELANLIRSRSDADGFVIIQGTDSIEETSFALDLLLDSGAPIIVTGAMRNPTIPGADGPANLLASVRAAATKSLGGAGVLVCLNDELHAARFVQKAHSSNPAAFNSLPAGPIGAISEDNVLVYFVPRKRPTLDVPSGNFYPHVALIASGIDDDGTLLSSLPDIGFGGVVLEASGAGHVTPGVAAAVEAVVKKIPVVVATRTRQGSTLTKTYDFIGSEVDLRRRGALFARGLPGVKARIALTYLLAKNMDRNQTQDWYRTTDL